MCTAHCQLLLLMLVQLAHPTPELLAEKLVYEQTVAAAAEAVAAATLAAEEAGMSYILYMSYTILYCVIYTIYTVVCSFVSLLCTM
jgi:hypothetical protein